MTFEEWWEKNKPGDGYHGAYQQGAYDYAKAAWNASGAMAASDGFSEEITLMVLARRLADVECKMKEITDKPHYVTTLTQGQWLAKHGMDFIGGDPLDMSGVTSKDLFDLATEPDPTDV